MKKTLLIALSYFPPQTGGISTLMSEVARRSGADTVVLTCVQSIEAKNHKGVIRIKTKANSRRRWLLVTWVAILTVIRNRPDLVVCATVEDAILASLIKRLFRLPFVVWTHGNEIVQLSDVETAWKRSIHALVAADKIISVSSFTAEKVKQLGIPSEKVVVIPPGCNVEQFRQNKKGLDRQQAEYLASGNKVLITVGNLVKRKGQDKVIECLPKIVRRYPNTTYIIVGSGRDKAHLVNVVKEHRMDKHVVFAGNVTQQALIQFYSISDVFLMPSRYIENSFDVEGFGIVFLEANCCGLPVIGGRAGGVPDAIQDGKSGFLVDPLDVNAISEKILFLLDHPKKAKAMGKWGRQRVIDNFSWHHMATQVQHEFNTVVDASKL